MLVIPDLKKVVIMPPRTGSTALKKLVMEVYPATVCPHRHGEVLMFNEGGRHVRQFGHRPYEYSFVYMLRDPVERMKSLWRYMQNVNPQRNPAAPEWWIRQQNQDADKPFSDWVMQSTSLFSAPYDANDDYYCCAIQVPAVHKSAAQYLRGLGNRKLEVIRAYNEDDMIDVLQIGGMSNINNSTPSIWDDTVTPEALASIKMHHAVDYALMEFFR